MMRYLLLFFTAVILFTVFIIDTSLCRESITGKYFWFAIAIGITVPVWAVCIVFRLLRGAVVYFRSTDLWILIFAVYTAVNYFLCNGWPDMQWWLFTLMIPLYAVVRTVCSNEDMKHWLQRIIVLFVLVEAIWGMMQLYGFAHSYHNLFPITGSLFNPGPYSCIIAVGIPLALAAALDKGTSKWERWFGAATLIASGLVLPATMSRAAWLAAVFASIPILWQVLKIRNSAGQGNSRNSYRWFLPFGQHHVVRFAFIAALCIIGAGLLMGLYYVKKDSADGRWLMWHVSMEMVKEHPVTGVGYGCFASMYGDAQAAYFLSGKGNETQTMVAGCPEYAFNEYMQITVELGLIGLFLFIISLSGIFFSRQSLKTESQTYRLSNDSQKWALSAMLVFAVFSYPFSVLPLLILFVVLLAMSAASSRRLFAIPAWVMVACITACLCVTFYGVTKILPKRQAYQEWQAVQVLYNSGYYEGLENEYQELYPKLRHEKQFLFEYAHCLSNAKQYAESNRIFGDFLHYSSDPMAYNCIGNNFKAMGDNRNAEDAYVKASQIVPHRHYPLYLLMKFYVDTGQTGKAREIADELLRKPVKIPSKAIEEMKEEAAKVLAK